MTLPSMPAFAWFLGTPEERNLGGRVMLMWADSVLPYSVDPPTVPGWWDQPGVDKGQFQSWIRNFAANGGTGAKNFPNDREGDPEDNRFFNCVIPHMQGLKLSESAPKRLKDYKPVDPTGPGGLPGPPQWNDSDGPGTLQEWPFREDDMHALNFLDFYMEEFVDSASTALIVMIPVREVMNFIAPADPNMFPPPNKEAGRAAIRDFVQGALTKAKALGITILGWYLIDEPDFLLFNYWATAAGVAELRLEVRKAEYDWRMDSPGSIPNDPEFLAIVDSPQGEIERQARLRPCVLTFSRDFGEAAPGAPPPRFVRRETPCEYAAAGAADLYLFDWYPYRRTIAEVESDWQLGGCVAADPDFSDLPAFAFQDSAFPMTPKVSLKRFRQMRRLLNLSGDPNKPDLLPGDPGYVPVALWSQGGGAVGPHFRDPDITTGTPGLEPARLPHPDQQGGEGCAPKDALFTRTKRMPTVDEIRYYLWAALFDLSEGLAVFTQFAVADNIFVQRFVSVARELAYFQSLRVSGINKTGVYVPRNLRYLTQADADFPKFSPVFWLPRFGAPPQPLQGIGPEGLMEWLVVINRESTPLTAAFDVSATGFPAGNWVLQEWKFLERIDSSILLVNRATSPNVSFPVEPFRMRLFQLRRHKPATDPPFP